MSQVSPAVKLFVMCLVVALCSSYATAQVRIVPQDVPEGVLRPEARTYTLPPSGNNLGLTGIPGSGPERSIVVRDWAFGSASVTGPSAGGGAAAGRSSAGPLVVVKDIDASTPMLFLASMMGRMIPSGEMRFELQGGSFHIVMTNITVVQAGRPADASPPLPVGQESVTLVAQEYSLRYQPTVGDPVEAGWNVFENRQL